MLTNNLKIIDTAKTEFLDLIFFQSYKKIRQKSEVGPFRPFNMLTVHKPSDLGLFGHLSNSGFAVYNFGKK